MIRALRSYALVAAVAVGAAVSGACAHHEFFAGTPILKTQENQAIISSVEEYRRRLVERNADGLLLLASERYREDSGTPRSDDDYGYEGLRQVLLKRLSRVKSIWYDIELRDMHVENGVAEVDVFINGSFELASESGDRYRHVSDYHRFVLEKQGEKWKFLSGM
jgi:hypothetical protein